MEDTKTVHFADKYFFNPTHPITVALIGCGGTGSLILARLARLDQAFRQLNHPGLQVTAYDGDIVESHNVGRQNFTNNDVNQNKAICLIEKINFAFGLQWNAVNGFVKSEIPKDNIIITAVDNSKFRMHIHNYFKKLSRQKQFDKDEHIEFLKRFYWLDTGNGKDFGQVVLSTIGKIEQPKKSQFKTQDKLPSVVDKFGNLNKYDNEEDQGIESCSFYESIQKQDLFINDAVSVQAVNILWKLLRDLHISYHGVIINQETLQQRGIIIK